MKRYITTIAFASAVLLSSANAYAIFDAQLLVGQRSAKILDEDANSQEVGVAVHVDPIPLVPLAFGFYANSMTFEEKDATSMDGAKGLEAGFQLYGWFPIGVAGLKPYAKVGIPLYSAIKGSQDIDDGAGGTVKVDSLFETSGMHINFGLGYSPIPMMAILFEVGLGQQKMKPKEIKFGGQKQDLSALGMEEEDYKSTSYSLGIEIGL